MFGLIVTLSLLGSPEVDSSGVDFFEREVRPVLVAKCTRCHGPLKQESGLRVDSRQALIEGGERGAAIVPSDVAASRLLAAIRHRGELKMPPDGKLSAREIQAFEHWIRIGAVWPAASRTRSPDQSGASDHWAFRPVHAPPVPLLKNSTWAVRTEIDAFILAELDARGLGPSPPADRRALIRRLYYTLVGLPPGAEEVRAFVDDPRPNAYALLVERLLQTPHYGEQWARHWLDVARYSDTKGYVYAREERFWLHAWTYRDWVVQALNADMPYDRFLLLQLAADQVEERKEGDLAAMGFLTLGRRFLGVTREIIDDRIDVVTRGTMGLTVSCARCHDHKYDPIATADYYSLYGVFDSCSERVVRLPDAVGQDRAFEDELASRQQKLEDELNKSRVESSDRVRQRIGDYLHAQTRLEEFPAKGFDQIFLPDDLLPAFVRRWERYLLRAERQGDPIFVPWHAYASIRNDSFAERAVDVTRELREAKRGDVHPGVAELFRDSPASFDEVVERYTQLFSGVDATWKETLEVAQAQKAEMPRRLSDPDDESLRRVLYGEGAPCEVPNEPIVNAEDYFDTRRLEKLWKLQKDVDRWILEAATPVRFASVLQDRAIASQPRIFRRGDPTRPGAAVARRFLPLLTEEPRPFERGSGRLELAKAIASPTNPLTARVIVNRVWAHHFGRGLVATPSDFGVRAGVPSHPELLDWLAARFVADGWSLKKLHRLIVLSSTFRQTSHPPDDARGRTALASDPDNRLLWRMNPRRLTFEEFRDSMLAVGGDLDSRVGGKPFDLFELPFRHRRTIYGLVDRQFFPTPLRTFDFANPDLHIPQRRETTVPQQALFFMNHPLVLDRARAVAKVGERAGASEAGVRELFRRVYQREPTATELAESQQLLRAASPAHEQRSGEASSALPPPASSSADSRETNSAAEAQAETVMPLSGWEQLAHLLLCTNEFIFID